MRGGVKWELIEFIIPVGIKKCIILCELLQEFLGFFVMHKTEIINVNAVKDFQREGIKLRTIF